MGTDPNNSMDVIDSRDIITRLDELEGDRDSLQTEVDDKAEELAQFEHDEGEKDGPTAKDITDARQTHQEAVDALEEWKNDDGDELNALKELADEADKTADWIHGEQLIQRSHFKDYAQELAEEIGALDKEDKWPLNCLDWDRAAEELEEDYMEVDFGGVEYLIRC